MSNVTQETIEEFLNGKNDYKYIVAIESEYGSNEVSLIIDDPEKGKRIETHSFKPFCFIKNFKKTKNPFYKGNKQLVNEAMIKNGISIKKLRTDGIPRMENGYPFLLESTKGVRHLNSFIKDGGVVLYPPKDEDEEKSDRNLAVMNKNIEQFLMQSHMRYFKGFDKYSDLHKFYFDIETTSLTAKDGHIFLLGMCDNRGFRKVLKIDYNDPIESERQMIIDFFDTIYKLSPTIVAGYNNESFDFTFILERAEILDINFGKMYDGELYYDVRTSLNPLIPIKRRDTSIKFGGETENYKQTLMWGINVIDISHAVRSAKAINSDIKGWGLKYITKFKKLNKPTRTYVEGDKIYKTWNEDKYFFMNKKNYAYQHIPDKFQSEEEAKNYLIKLKAWVNSTNDHNSIVRLREFCDNDGENLELIKGSEIVYNYLLDDLEETMAVDEEFGQSNFMLGKNMPTDYVRTTTMGNAVKWKLLMIAFSYMEGLAIPVNDYKKDIVGGLSRLLQCGYAKNVLKMDYSSLYPSIQLSDDVFPSVDITGVMKVMLSYFRDARNKYKDLGKLHKKRFEQLNEKIDLELSSLYDTKQLPVKILNNSQFGAISAPYIFNWGDNNVGEMITCSGRQFLRLMVWFFNSKGFKPLVGDSVTWNTPIYIRDKNGLIDIIPIEETFNENECVKSDSGDRDFSEKDYEVLTVNGWKKLKYSYRHGTDKKIHKIETKDRVINVTSDHSLFQNGNEIKPSELKRGDKLDIYNISNFNSLSNITLDKAWVYGFFLGDGSANNSSRISSYISKKTGLKTNKKGGKRSDWKISNTRLDFLEKIQNILKKEFGVESRIKNHLNSSGVYNLVVTKVDFCDFFCKEFYTKKRYKKVPKLILNSNKEIKESFLNGVCASDGYGDNIIECISIGMKSEIAIAGISMISKELGLEYRLKTRLDKTNFNTLLFKHNKNGIKSEFKNKSIRKTDEVWKNTIIENDDPNNYVYDISTEDGTFIGGIGMINCHNTDGFNFSMPDNHEELTYIDKDGKEHKSYEAVLKEFNETYMYGVMQLSLDGLYDATINIARKNYIDLNNDNTIKLVGNSLKATTLCKYFENAINEGVRYLVNGDGKSFIEMYYSKLEQIYNMEVPIIQIASKAKVKEKIPDYLYDLEHKKDKNGKKIARKAYMELLVKANYQPDIGSYVYYINQGTTVTATDVDHGVLLDENDFISDPDRLGEYNTKQAVSNFNKRMKIFLVCFKDVVRESLIQKDPKKRMYYTDEDMELTSGSPLDIKKQDVMYPEEHKPEMENEPFMDMSEKEVLFWNRVDKDPKDIFPHFTTVFSREPLLSAEDKVRKKEEKEEILRFFKNYNSEIKDELDYLADGDVFIRYGKLFNYLGEITNEKTGKVTKGMITKELDKMSWILTKFDKGRRVDIETIDYEAIINELEM